MIGRNDSSLILTVVSTVPSQLSIGIVGGNVSPVLLIDCQIADENGVFCLLAFVMMCESFTKFDM